MKKIICLALAVIFTILCFSACGGSEDDGGDFVYETLETEYLTFQFPKNWSFSAGKTVVIQSKDNLRGINLYTTAYTEDFESTTADSLKAKLSAVFDEGIELQNYQFKKDTTKGFDMFAADFDIVSSGTEYHEIVYMAHIGSGVHMIMLYYAKDTDSTFVSKLYETLDKK